jgi:hypothetical protein
MLTSLTRRHARHAERLSVDQIGQRATHDASPDVCHPVTHGSSSGRWSCPGLLPRQDGSYAHVRTCVPCLVINDHRPHAA